MMDLSKVSKTTVNGYLSAAGLVLTACAATLPVGPSLKVWLLALVGTIASIRAAVGLKQADAPEVPK